MGFGTDCAVCLPGYTQGMGYSCLGCSEGSEATLLVVGVIVALIAGLLFVEAFNFLTFVTDGKSRPAHRNGFDKLGSKIQEAIPLQRVKIVIVMWQIITEVGTGSVAQESCLPPRGGSPAGAGRLPPMQGVVGGC